MPHIHWNRQFCLSYNLFLITQCQWQFALTAKRQMEESLQHLLPPSIFKNCTPAIFLSMVRHLPSSCWRFYTCHLPVDNSTPVIFLLTVLRLPSSCWQFYTCHLPVDNFTPAIFLLTILHLKHSVTSCKTTQDNVRCMCIELYMLNWATCTFGTFYVLLW